MENKTQETKPEITPTEDDKQTALEMAMSFRSYLLKLMKSDDDADIFYLVSGIAMLIATIRFKNSRK